MSSIIPPNSRLVVPIGTSIWVFMPADRDEQNWIYVPNAEPIYATVETPAQLRRDGWRLIEQDKDPHLLMILHGQLATVLNVAWPGGRQEKWAQVKDIEYAQRVPITLMFDLAPMGIKAPSTTEIMMITETLPPPLFGSVGTVRLRTNGPQGQELYRMPLSWLTDRDKEVWSRLSDTIKEIGAPENWRPTSTEIAFLYGSPNEYATLRAQLRNEKMAAFTGPRREEAERKSEALKADYENYKTAMERNAWRQEHASEWATIMKGLQEMAQDLAAGYWRVYQERTAQPKAPHTPDVFAANKGKVSIISAQPVQAVMTAISAAQSDAQRAQRRGVEVTMPSWPLSDGMPTFTRLSSKTDKSKGFTHVQMRSGTPDEMAAMVVDDTQTRALQDAVSKLNDRTNNVFMAVMAQVLMAPDADTLSTVVRADQFLDYLGIKKKTGPDDYTHGHREEDMREIGLCLRQLASIWIDYAQPMLVNLGKGGKVKKSTRIQTHRGVLMAIDEVVEHRKSDKDAQPYPIAWRVRLGTWARNYMEAPNRQTVYLMQKVISYDTYHELWEARLARHFLMRLRINVKSGQVANIIGPLLDELTLDIDERHPQDTMDRFTKAMNKITEHGIISEWRYEVAQEGKPHSPAGLPPRKWVETWRDMKIIVMAAPLGLPQMGDSSEQ